MNKKYLAGLVINDLHFTFEISDLLILKYFKNFAEYPVKKNIKTHIIPSVCPEKLIKETYRLQNRAFAEYSLLFENTVNTVLPLDHFFFHGAAFYWNGKAFLFAGKSGIGKTTQLKNWLKLYGKEIEIINGDKPIIELKEDNRFIVHPSPWTGKEGWNGNMSGELGGIILLEQGKENSISRMSVKEAVYPIFLQFLYKPDNIESVNLVCDYEHHLLNSVPVWNLINTGDEDSAKLTYKVLSNEGFR